MAENKNKFNLGGLIGGIAGGALGMIGQNARARKQHERQKELMGIQAKNQNRLNAQGAALQMDMWNKTNYGAQVKHLNDAGLNPGLLYGMSGGGGTTSGSQTGGSAQGGNAAAPMDIGASVQAGLMLAQTEKLKAETKKIAQDEGTGKATMEKIMQEVETEKAELTKLKIENRLSKEQFQNKLKELELANAGKLLENELTVENIWKTETERKSIIEGLRQKWKELDIKDKEARIKKFSEEIKANYPSVWNVAGRSMDKILMGLSKIFGQPVENRIED